MRRHSGPASSSPAEQQQQQQQQQQQPPPHRSPRRRRERKAGFKDVMEMGVHAGGLLAVLVAMAASTWPLLSPALRDRDCEVFAATRALSALAAGGAVVAAISRLLLYRFALRHRVPRSACTAMLGCVCARPTSSAYCCGGSASDDFWSRLQLERARRRSRALAVVAFVVLLLATAAAMAALAVHVRVTAVESLVAAASWSGEEGSERVSLRRCCNEFAGNATTPAARVAACSMGGAVQQGSGSNAHHKQLAALGALSQVPLWARQCVPHCLALDRVTEEHPSSAVVPKMFLAIGTHALAISVPYVFLILFRYNRDKVEDAATSVHAARPLRARGDGSDYSRVGLAGNVS